MPCSIKVGPVTGANAPRPARAWRSSSANGIEATSAGFPDGSPSRIKVGRWTGRNQPTVTTSAATVAIASTATIAKARRLRAVS